MMKENSSLDNHLAVTLPDNEPLLYLPASIQSEVYDPILDARETRPSSLENTGFHVYKRRWYVLGLFSLLKVLQCLAWNTWGPIADTSKVVLNWTDGDISLLTSWGQSVFILSGLAFSWILDTKGLRVSVVCAALFLLIGLGIRCLPVGIEHVKWTMNVGQIFIGLAAPVVIAAPTFLSAVWFPPHQRTTATAISTISNYVGIAMSFLIGPLIVTDIESTNSTSIHTNDESDDLTDTRTNHFSEIMLLMYIECGAGAILALCTLVYYPAKPPTPPSASAATTRESFKKGAIHLAKNVQFWLIGLAYSLSLGIYGSWVTQLDVICQQSGGVTQETVGWIGFYTNVAGSIGGLIFASFVDRFGGYMKRLLLALATLASGSCLWCVLLSLKLIPFHIEFLYISCISLGFFLSSSAPIYFEMTVEGVYPVAEGITTMALTWMSNVTSLLFLLVPLIPRLGVDWMNWIVLGATVISVPLLLLYRESYKRMQQDQDNRVNGDIR